MSRTYCSTQRRRMNWNESTIWKEKLPNNVAGWEPCYYRFWFPPNAVLTCVRVRPRHATGRCVGQGVLALGSHSATWRIQFQSSREDTLQLKVTIHKQFSWDPWVLREDFPKLPHLKFWFFRWKHAYSAFYISTRFYLCRWEEGGEAYA